MHKLATTILSALVLLCMPVGATNAQNPVDEALKGCSKELKRTAVRSSQVEDVWFHAQRLMKTSFHRDVFTLSIEPAIGWDSWRAALIMLPLSVRRTH